MDHFLREGLDFEVDAGDLSAAILLMAAGTLAKLGKADVAGLAEFETGGDEDAVDVNAGLAFEFKEHVDGSGVICATAEHPTAATQDCAREGVNQSSRFLDGDSLHLHRPGNGHGLCRFELGHGQPHNGVIGGWRWSLTYVQESNGLDRLWHTPGSGESGGAVQR